MNTVGNATLSVLSLPKERSRKSPAGKNNCRTKDDRILSLLARAFIMDGSIRLMEALRICKLWMSM